MDTPRLRLQPLSSADLSDLQTAASIRDVADTMISLPHPYPPGEAERYYERQKQELKAEKAYVYVIRQKEGGIFCGMIEVRAIERDHSQAELSFWISKEVWGKGYMSEALGAFLPFCFETLRINRLYAHHMQRNPATARVLEKNGFSQEGLLRQRVIKWGIFEDVYLWAILKKDWQKNEE